MKLYINIYVTQNISILHREHGKKTCKDLGLFSVT